MPIVEGVEQQTDARLKSLPERFPPLTRAEVLAAFDVDVVSGKCFWRTPSKYHKDLIGKEAGFASLPSHSGRRYWIVNFQGVPYKRSYLVFVAASGFWPRLTLDHINGDSLEDSYYNLREASTAQNNWNQRTHRKNTTLPRGIRKTANGRFQARIGCNGKTTYATFQTLELAEEFYIESRRRLFGAYCGLCPTVS